METVLTLIVIAQVVSSQSKFFFSRCKRFFLFPGRDFQYTPRRSSGVSKVFAAPSQKDYSNTIHIYHFLLSEN